ncbi:MAG: glycoside hydrolase family 16 protein [Bacteroidaceae bacterium]|nr:glycoside hydrolase family 16 protein [Bacteroidaceae bacterium]
MKQLEATALLMLCSLYSLAQSMTVYQGGQQTFFNINEVDSITFDNTHNLWQDANPQVGFYYAPGWNQTTDPTYTENKGTYTLTLKKATSEQWQAQMYFITDLQTDAYHNYSFRIKLRSSKAVTATVKLNQDGNTKLYYFEEKLSLNADEEYIFERKDMSGLDMSRVVLVLDFGGNKLNTTVNISGITLTETEYDSSQHQDSCPLPDYKLVWHDEFSTSAVNTTRWSYQNADAGWVNNELQTYVSGRSPKGTKVAECSNGTLKIHTFKEGDKVYSARMYGKRSTGFRYGYIEARIKLPKGKGSWPAWWMFPIDSSNWPACGEIDIMEEVGVDPNLVSSSFHTLAYNHVNHTQKTHEMYCVGAEEGFHVYAIEWTEDYMRTSVDGIEQLYFENDHQGNNDTWPFSKPFFLILNVAWGGDWGGYAGVDETALPLTMEVDYVRVWQKK